MKIIRNKEIWLRNATVMNDFSEIGYGLTLARNGLASPAGKKFYTEVESVFPDFQAKIEDQICESEMHWRFETYLSCLSLHQPSEDQNGRLSMWRAYGEVAFIMNNTPFVAETDKLGVYSTPVHYLDQGDFDEQMLLAIRKISANVDHLRKSGRDAITNDILAWIFQSAIGVKHPGFLEESEWRIYFRTTGDEHPVLTKRVENVRGIPQPIWAIPLKHDPDSGLFGADIPNLLDRMIIGPTAYPYVSYKAFTELLSTAGVDDAESKVVVSDIPLRRLE